jgi:Holliday junction resolvase RusA-like endonuclease
VLTPEGKRYKKETTAHISRNYVAELREIEQNIPYLLIVVFQFADPVALVNKGYPTSTKSRFKRLDVTNRMKLFEDALVDATAADDAQHWTVLLHKTCGVEDRTHLWVSNLEDHSDRATAHIGAFVGSLLQDAKPK